MNYSMICTFIYLQKYIGLAIKLIILPIGRMKDYSKQSPESFILVCSVHSS